MLAAGLGVWLGARAGWRHGSRFDRLTSRLGGDALLGAGVVAGADADHASSPRSGGLGIFPVGGHGRPALDAAGPASTSPTTWCCRA